MGLDLRAWLKEIEALEELQKIDDPVERDLEMGTIAALAMKNTRYAPAMIFNTIKGFPGYHMLVNQMGSPRRLCHTLGIDTNRATLLEVIKLWRERFTTLAPLPHRVVADGPILENVSTGKDVHLSRIASPLWHERDGGRYPGTACMVITRDPDTGIANIGTYRVMAHDDTTLAFYISPGKDGRMHRERYFKEGKPCPVAVCFGQHPLLYMMSATELAYGACEYDYAGAIAGAPVEVIEGPVTGLPIPAWAEIAVEGIADPSESRIEGPFGEATGYYGSSSRPEPVIRVKSILHRDNPIMCGAPPVRPPSEQVFFKNILSSVQIWDELEKAGVPGVKGVWRDTRYWVVVAIEQKYQGHAKQAGVVASQCKGGAYSGRYVIVVDEDIDPTNIDDVLWALRTRCDPENSIDIIRRCWSTHLDPIIPTARKGLNSRAIIEATRPYEWINDFPPVVDPSPALAREVMSKWSHIIQGKTRKQ